MSRYLFIVFTAVALTSCNDGKSNTSESTQNINPDTISVDSLPPGNIQEERDAMQTEREVPREDLEPVVTAGKFKKVTDDNSASDCDYIEVSYDRATRWCIDKDKMYVSARCEKTGDNTANVYFVAASEGNSPDRDMPWDEFDTNTPIATLSFQPDGSAELDWLGFSKNGEVVTDYALYGKKSLEGTYKKE